MRQATDTGLCNCVDQQTCMIVYTQTVVYIVVDGPVL